MQTLSLVASLCFIFNKMLLLNSSWKIPKKIKWSVGFTAAILFIFYFFGIGSPILATLEIGLTILTLYRTLSSKKPKGVVEKLIGGFVVIVLLVLFIERYTGYIETIQLFGAIGMLVGTFFLIRDKYKWGFALYAIGHVFTTIYGYQQGEFIFWWLQLLQACMCLTIFIRDKYGAREEAIIEIVIIFMAVGAVIFLHINNIKLF